MEHRDGIANGMNAGLELRTRNKFTEKRIGSGRAGFETSVKSYLGDSNSSKAEFSEFSGQRPSLQRACSAYQIGTSASCCSRPTYTGVFSCVIICDISASKFINIPNHLMQLSSNYRDKGHGTEVKV